MPIHLCHKRPGAPLSQNPPASYIGSYVYTHYVCTINLNHLVHYIVPPACIGTHIGTYAWVSMASTRRMNKV